MGPRGKLAVKFQERAALGKAGWYHPGSRPPSRAHRGAHARGSTGAWARRSAGRSESARPMDVMPANQGRAPGRPGALTFVAA